jgi:hypothetical protein
MTVETKTTIQLNDITTIDFECGKCHMITSCPIQSAQHPQAACACSPQEQWMPYAGDTYRELSKLIELIKRFGGSAKEPYTLRFGIKNESLAHASRAGD